MNINTQKIEIAQLIFNTDDKSILKRVREVLNESHTGFMNHLTDDIKTSVLKSIKQLDEGKGIPHDEALKKIKKWQKK